MTNTDQESIKNIEQAIRSAEVKLRAKHTWLKHQNAIGAAILFVSLAGMILGGWAYIEGAIPAWLCIINAAFFASLTHELEHDLIHRQYFRKKQWAQNLMILLVWIARPNTFSPWKRRIMHFNHHKISGTEHDIEERILGNGMKWGIVRFLATIDSFASMTMRYFELRNVNNYSYIRLVAQSTPFGFIYTSGLILFAALQVLILAQSQFGVTWTIPAEYESFANIIVILAVTWFLPNTLRSFSLNLVTSTMHYYGGVKNVLQQCQVLTHPLFLPFQLFCFNFGATHGMHHFVVGQPFYIRQAIASEVHPVMKENGVRFNDLGTMKRANHYNFSESN
jgi:fatty acid desaturase